MPSSSHPAGNLVAALLLAILLPLSGCSPSAGPERPPKAATTYHLDAILGFAVEYPSDWVRQRPEAAQTARWTPAEPGTELEASVTVVAPERTGGAPAAMLADFVAAHPGFSESGRRELVLGPAALPAWEVLGHTPAAAWLVYLVAAPGRGYILALRAPPPEFDRLRPVFAEMATSFTPLD